MSFWSFLASFFLLVSAVLGYFVLFPERLLDLHRWLTQRDAVRELDGAHYAFMRLTRRVCAVPMAICLLIALGFSWSALNYSRMSEAREKHDNERREKIQKFGAGSIYSQAWQQSAGKMPPPAGKSP